MPRATVMYSFEWKLFHWAHCLSDLLAGENRCFLVIADPDGAVRQLLVGEDEYEHDRQVWGGLMQSKPCWLFYHPFDGPAYTYMSWQGMEQGVVERLIGERFEEDDFSESGRPGSLQAAEERIEFPESWSVMF